MIRHIQPDNTIAAHIMCAAECVVESQTMRNTCPHNDNKAVRVASIVQLDNQKFVFLARQPIYRRLSMFYKATSVRICGDAGCGWLHGQDIKYVHSASQDITFKPGTSERG